MTRLLPPAALLMLALAIGAPADVRPADIRVERLAAVAGDPSPAARTCELRFRHHTAVWTSCTMPCYEEAWDGPVLMAVNTCATVRWVSYVFSADDGRTWRSPCYELPPAGTPVAIPESTLAPGAERRVLIVHEPGSLGYVHAAPMAACPVSREVQPSTAGQ